MKHIKGIWDKYRSNTERFQYVPNKIFIIRKEWTECQGSIFKEVLLEEKTKNKTYKTYNERAYHML